MQSDVRALWFTAPGQAEWRPVALPAADGVNTRVHALYSGVSRGTESLVFRGLVPPSEHDRMRAPFQDGDFPFPVKYGYAAVGRTADGRLVFALHPHQSVFALPADSLLPLPAGLPPRRAVLAANVETALNALWDAGALPAMRIAVVGAGVVGALVAWLAGRLPGAAVTLVDTLPSRADLARRLGVAFAAPDAAPQACDLVFHASASAAGLATALACAGDEAQVVELSWYGDGQIPAALGGAFHSRRLRLVASQVGRIAPAMRARWDHRRRLAAALALCADPALDALLEPDCAADDAPARLAAVLAPGSGALCLPIKYPTE